MTATLGDEIAAVELAITTGRSPYADQSALRSAIARLEAMQWRPISERPLENVDLVGVTPSRHLRTGIFFNSGRDWDSLIDDRTGRFYRVKHWMRLGLPEPQEGER